MKPTIDLLTASDYLRVIRPLLPKNALLPQPQRLWHIAMHLLVVVLCYYGIRQSTNIWCWSLLGLVIGHSLACLAFFAHDMSHGSIVRNRQLKGILELTLWGLNVIPPAMWKQLHNQTHHIETNTINDPDRLYRKIEETTWTRLYTRWLYPTSHTLSGSPVVFFHFTTYIARHVVTAFLPGRLKPSIVTYKPEYTPSDKMRIATQIFAIGIIQIGIYLFVGGGWKFIWASPFALFVSSSVVMAYVWTQHLLNPLCEHTDPLAGTTSVEVPKWADWLHDNFSYHVEHHIFPSMNPCFYPLVSRLLKTNFPDRYRRVPFIVAWRQLWRIDEFIVEPGTQFTKSNGEGNS